MDVDRLLLSYEMVSEQVERSNSIRRTGNEDSSSSLSKKAASFDFVLSIIANSIRCEENRAGEY